jgi:hypothetical protein
VQTLLFHGAGVVAGSMEAQAGVHINQIVALDTGLIGLQQPYTTT